MFRWILNGCDSFRGFKKKKRTGEMSVSTKLKLQETQALVPFSLTAFTKQFSYQTKESISEKLGTVGLFISCTTLDAH